VDQTGNLNPTTYASNDIADPNVFASVYAELIGGLTSQLINTSDSVSGGGVVYNILNVTSIPFLQQFQITLWLWMPQLLGIQRAFFQAVAGIFIQVLIQQKVPPAQAQAIAAQYAITFNEDPNRFVIDVPVTQTNPLVFRQMQENELLLLSINQAALAQGYESVALTPEVQQVLGILQQGATPTPEQAQLVLDAVNGIDDQDALDSSELSAISNARLSYNSTIQSLAEVNGLAFCRCGRFITECRSGLKLSRWNYHFRFCDWWWIFFGWCTFNPLRLCSYS
jgi:hypothetical protein